MVDSACFKDTSTCHPCQRPRAFVIKTWPWLTNPLKVVLAILAYHCLSVLISFKTLPFSLFELIDPLSNEPASQFDYLWTSPRSPSTTSTAFGAQRSSSHYSLATQMITLFKSWHICQSISKQLASPFQLHLSTPNNTTLAQNNSFCSFEISYAYYVRHVTIKDGPSSHLRWGNLHMCNGLTVNERAILVIVRHPYFVRSR